MVVCFINTGEVSGSSQNLLAPLYPARRDTINPLETAGKTVRVGKAAGEGNLVDTVKTVGKKHVGFIKAELFHIIQEGLAGILFNQLLQSFCGNVEMVCRHGGV